MVGTLPAGEPRALTAVGRRDERPSHAGTTLGVIGPKLCFKSCVLSLGHLRPSEPGHVDLDSARLIIDRHHGRAPARARRPALLLEPSVERLVRMRWSVPPNLHVCGFADAYVPIGAVLAIDRCAGLWVVAHVLSMSSKLLYAVAGRRQPLRPADRRLLSAASGDGACAVAVMSCRLLDPRPLRSLHYAKPDQSRRSHTTKRITSRSPSSRTAGFEIHHDEAMSQRTKRRHPSGGRSSSICVATIS